MCILILMGVSGLAVFGWGIWALVTQREGWGMAFAIALVFFVVAFLAFTNPNY